MQVSFGKWIGAAAVVTVGIGIIEAYNPRLAMIVAGLLLFAIFTRYPSAIAEIGALFGLRNPLPPNERT